MLADDLRREGVQGKCSVCAPVYASAGEIPCARAAAGMLTCCMSCCSSANHVVAPSEAKSHPKMATRLLNGHEPSSTESSTVSASKVKLLIFETNPDHVGVKDRAVDILAGSARRAGLDVQVFGTSSVFRGFGTKYSAAVPILREIESDTLVVLADARDVLVNVGTVAADLSRTFRASFEKLVEDSPNAVVVSAESNCCVSALTHIKPGDLFHSDTGGRIGRTCRSGFPGCTWNGDDKIAPWAGYMSSVSRRRVGGHVRDTYLNAGLMAGRTSDLLALIEKMDILDEEDDQAVLTDLLHHAPHMLRLDYEQMLFGNTRWAMGLNDGCVFSLDRRSGALIHSETGTTPILIHNPGKFWECHDRLAGALQQSPARHEPRGPGGWHLRGNHVTNGNDRGDYDNYGDCYGNYGYGSYGNYGYGSYGNYASYGNYGCHGNSGNNSSSYGNYSSVSSCQPGTYSHDTGEADAPVRQWLHAAPRCSFTILNNMSEYP